MSSTPAMMLDHWSSPPVHNEQSNPNDAQQPIDENEPIEENIEQPSLPAPRQNLPEPSIQQGKGLN